jgi:phosphate starvation-inducible membrane PsiE
MIDKNKYKYGIGFWAGAGIYSLINMIMNLNHRSQDKILVYDGIITGVAVIGLILCIYLLNKRKEN